MAEPSAADRAYAHTKELILSGAAAGGTLLTEGEVATELQMSRTPVREAFLRLQSERLLALAPKRGATVVPIGRDEAREVLQVRRALEIAAVEQLVLEGRTDPLMAQILPIIAEQRRLARLRDLLGFAALDATLHRTIAAAGGNRIACQVYDGLTDRQRRMSVAAIRSLEHDLLAFVEDHEDLADCIGRGDVRGFATVLTRHFVEHHHYP
ncbi:MAG: transcriptional regulator, GntR family [Frankiales bacterium]|nr:transcriptional regulator, GntR family [Frankiales bacterium]